MPVTVSENYFGIFEGKQVKKYTITHSDGISVSFINYGAAIQSLMVPGKDGQLSDVILGFETLNGYINAGTVYMGCICGRFANRINNGKFSLEGVEYILPQNDGKNTLHGGFKGFDKVYWNAVVLKEKDSIVFSYESKDGEQGFPGNLNVTVTYQVTRDTLRIIYSAVTDKSTPVSLTSHCYFNLSGGRENTIFNHQLYIGADYYLEVDDCNIPTGKLKEVAGSNMDFNYPTPLNNRIKTQNVYDHCWVLSKTGNKLLNAAILYHPESCIKMMMRTTEPGLQFYSGAFLDGSLSETKNAVLYSKYTGLCLEAQHFPDSPNQPTFPHSILLPGKKYHQETTYTFIQSKTIIL
jgi:aldose 1-epimerase